MQVTDNTKETLGKTAERLKQHLCSMRRSRLIKDMTPTEKLFAKRLDEAGIKYISQKGFIAGKGFCFVDFYLPRPCKLAIEIDGSSHDIEQIKHKDLRKEAYLASRRIGLIRIKNASVNNFDLKLLTSHQ